jgi:hypothetical protein
MRHLIIEEVRSFRQLVRQQAAPVEHSGWVPFLSAPPPLLIIRLNTWLTPRFLPHSNILWMQGSELIPDLNSLQLYHQ